MKRLAILALALAAFATPAFAADQIKATIGQRGNWDTAVIHLGTKAGIFEKHNIEVEPVYTSGSGETLQPVISGSVDLGFAVGTLGAMAAYAKGAPVRIIGAQATGAADYWYAKASSPIKTLKDTNDKTHRVLDARLLDQFDRARLHQGVRPEGQAAADRQPLLHAHRRDDRSGRRRLGLAAVRPEGDRRRARSASSPRRPMRRS